jgi:hypothetical protein
MLDSITTSIYKPTYLYIKQHSITGLKYFGKTIRNPLKYIGSGTYWIRHINKHGREYVITIWYKLFNDKETLIEYAINFSKTNNIVESIEWGNIVEENGLDGGHGIIFSKERKKKLSDIHKGNKNHFFGKKHKQISLDKMSEGHRGNKGRVGKFKNGKEKSIRTKNPNGRIWSEERKRNFGESRKGDKNANWGKKGKDNSKYGKGKIIQQLTKEGVLVKESTRGVFNDDGFFSSNVSKCCLGKMTYYKGFIWRYKVEF